MGSWFCFKSLCGDQLVFKSERLPDFFLAYLFTYLFINDIYATWPSSASSRFDWGPVYDIFSKTKCI